MHGSFPGNYLQVQLLRVGLIDAFFVKGNFPGKLATAYTYSCSPVQVASQLWLYDPIPRLSQGLKSE